MRFSLTVFRIPNSGVVKQVPKFSVLEDAFRKSFSVTGFISKAHASARFDEGMKSLEEFYALENSAERLQSSVLHAEKKFSFEVCMKGTRFKHVSLLIPVPNLMLILPFVQLTKEGQLKDTLVRVK